MATICNYFRLCSFLFFHEEFLASLIRINEWHLNLVPDITLHISTSAQLCVLLVYEYYAHSEVQGPEQLNSTSENQQASNSVLFRGLHNPHISGNMVKELWYKKRISVSWKTSHFNLTQTIYFFLQQRKDSLSWVSPEFLSFWCKMKHCIRLCNYRHLTMHCFRLLRHTAVIQETICYLFLKGD